MSAYGPQGWWPVSTVKMTAGDTLLLRDGYHPRNYTLPESDEQRFEICLGAILVQNTNWLNVPPALKALRQKGLFLPDKLAEAENQQIALAIKRCGYYNQKARYLKHIAKFFRLHPFSELEQEPLDEIRNKLLKIKGIGPETADCILLYAFKKCSFVIDAYTVRIFSHLGLIDSAVSYHELKGLIESELKPELEVYQEYHALLVCHGKLHYRRKPYGSGDQLLLP